MQSIALTEIEFTCSLCGETYRMMSASRAEALDRVSNYGCILCVEGVVLDDKTKYVTFPLRFAGMSDDGVERFIIELPICMYVRN